MNVDGSAGTTMPGVLLSAVPGVDGELEQAGLATASTEWCCARRVAAKAH